MFGWFGFTGVSGGVQPALEVIHRRTAQAGNRRPLLFVHGAYAGAWCWDEHFMPFLAELGHDCHALSLRGHGESGGRESVHAHSLADYVNDLRRIVETLPVEPVLVGHSMGGMVIQKYLEDHAAAAAILMAPVPPSGLGGSVFRLMTSEPMLFGQISLFNLGGKELADMNTAARAVFSAGLDSARLQRYAERMQTESQRALFDMTFGALPQRWRMNVPPMLVMGADDDALFSPEMMQSTAEAYRADLVMIPDMAHAMMLEPHWRRAADLLASWLEAQPAARA